MSWGRVAKVVGVAAFGISCVAAFVLALGDTSTLIDPVPGPLRPEDRFVWGMLGLREACFGAVVAGLLLIHGEQASRMLRAGVWLTLVPLAIMAVQFARAAIPDMGWTPPGPAGLEVFDVFLVPVLLAHPVGLLLLSITFAGLPEPRWVRISPTLVLLATLVSAGAALASPTHAAILVGMLLVGGAWAVLGTASATIEDRLSRPLPELETSTA